MIGFLGLVGLVLLLVLALGPAHRRAALPWRPGFDTRRDRDFARLQEDLRFAGLDPAPGGPSRSAAKRDDPPGPDAATLAA